MSFFFQRKAPTVVQSEAAVYCGVEIIGRERLWSFTLPDPTSASGFVSKGVRGNVSRTEQPDVSLALICSAHPANLAGVSGVIVLTAADRTGRTRLHATQLAVHIEHIVVFLVDFSFFSFTLERPPGVV
ncbi:hypothetical protein MHYP_G00234910 [Metynnis hypsauchen]